MHTLKSLSFACALLVAPATIHAYRVGGTATANVVQQTSAAQKLGQETGAAKKLTRQLNGLSVSPLGKLAFWRDRALRTPDVVRAMERITTFLKAKQTLGHKDHNLVLDDPNSGRGLIPAAERTQRLVITTAGKVRVLDDWGFQRRLASYRTSRRGEQLAAAIKDIANKIELGQPVETVSDFPGR